MRILTASLVTLSFLATPVLASAHDVKKKTPDLSDLKLPSESEIEQIIEDMPDLNKLMDGMLAIAQDEDIEMLGIVGELQEAVEENFDEELFDTK